MNNLFLMIVLKTIDEEKIKLLNNLHVNKDDYAKSLNFYLKEGINQ